MAKAPKTAATSKNEKILQGSVQSSGNRSRQHSSPPQSPATLTASQPRPTIWQAARQLQAANPLGQGDVIAARDPKNRSTLVAVVRTENGHLYVVPDRCPHDGGLLSDGFVENGHLVCARHGWEFNPETGQCLMHSACVESRRLIRERSQPTLPIDECAKTVAEFAKAGS